MPGLILPFVVRALRISPGQLLRRKLGKSIISFTEATKELSSEGDLQPQSTLTRFKPIALQWEALVRDYLLSNRLRALGVCLI